MNLNFALLYDNPFELLANLTLMAETEVKVEFVSRDDITQETAMPIAPATIPIIGLLIGYRWNAYQTGEIQFFIRSANDADHLFVKLRMPDKEMAAVDFG